MLHRLTVLASALALGPLAIADGTPDTVVAKEPSSTPAPKLEKFCLTLEPKLLSGGVFVLVPGARRTGIAPAHMTKHGLRKYTEKEFRALGLKWREFYAKGTETAARQVTGLTPKFVRDEKKVIQYAIIQSENPLAASAVLAPGFRERFTESLGEKLYVAIPNRHTILVFPRLSETYRDYGEIVIDLYDLATWPVSLELFEITKLGIRAVGAFKKN